MGMVAFNTPGSADKAMQAHEATPLRFEDKELQVRFGSMTKLNPPSKTLFCTNFRPDALDAIEKRLTYLFSPWAVPKRFRYGARRVWVVSLVILTSSSANNQHVFHRLRLCRGSNKDHRTTRTPGIPGPRSHSASQLCHQRDAATTSHFMRPRVPRGPLDIGRLLSFLQRWQPHSRDYVR